MLQAGLLSCALPGHFFAGSQSRKAPGSVALGVPWVLSRKVGVLDAPFVLSGCHSRGWLFPSVPVSPLYSRANRFLSLSGRQTDRQILEQNSYPFPLPLLPPRLKDAQGWPCLDCCCLQAALHWEGAAMPSSLSLYPGGKPGLICPGFVMLTGPSSRERWGKPQLLQGCSAPGGCCKGHLVRGEKSASRRTFNGINN